MRHVGRLHSNDGLARASDVLINVGPLAEVSLSPSPDVAAILTGSGKPLPTRVVKMMVDTGAQKTVVEDKIAAALGLVPLRFTPMVGVSQKPELCPLYLMSVHIAMTDGKKNTVVTFTAEIIGMASPPQPQLHAGLLGRDFLSHFKMVYDGKGGIFEIIGQLPGQGTPRRGKR